MYYQKTNEYSSRAELLVAIQSLAAEDKQALLHEVLKDDDLRIIILKNASTLTDGTSGNLQVMTADSLISAFGSLTADEREDIINTVNGREYQYRLTCPNYEDAANILKTQGPGNITNRSVIIGYHIGMMNNWRVVVKDQLNTLYQCGLGALADHIYISYSSSNELEEELQDLKAILNQYSFARHATLYHNDLQPIEGLAINKLHEDCTKRAVDSPHIDTVAFYFHTKGTSRFSPDWESTMDQVWTYSHVMYWRKHMEYFTIERPSLCMKQIFDNGKFGCGVHYIHGFYSGNFWAASCRYISSLNSLTFYPLNESDRRYDAERFVQFETGSENFVSLDEPPVNFYEELYPPNFFSDYSHKWQHLLHPDEPEIST